MSLGVNQFKAVMGNHGSNNRDTIKGHHLCKNLSAADTDSRICRERETRQQPRNGEKMIEDGKFRYQKKLEKKSREKRRNKCRKNPLALNMQGLKLIDENQGEGCCLTTGSLAHQEMPLSGDNCKTAGTRDVNTIVTKQTENTGIRKSTFEPETAVSVREFKKYHSVINPSEITQRKTKEKSVSIGKNSLPINTSNVSPRNMNQMASVTMNHTTYATINTSLVSAKNMSSATMNHIPSSVSRRRFCIWNRRDTNSLRAQTSIWFPCLYHKPTLKALRDAVSRMKRRLCQELCKHEILDFNKHIAESKEQRDLFRKEHLQERSSKYEPVKLISAMVPECQNRICSLNFVNKNPPLTSLKNVRENFGTEQKPIISTTNATNNPERSPVTGHELLWKDSLMFSNCEKFQKEAPSQISTNSIYGEKGKPVVVIQTKQLNIPEWFQSMLRKEVTITIRPACPSRLTAPSSEIKQLMNCQKRLYLDLLFPNSDLSAGDGCLWMSEGEHELVRLHSDMSTHLPRNRQSKHSRSHSRKSRQKQVAFVNGKQKARRELGVSVQLHYKYFANASPWSESYFSQENHTNYLECSADSLLDNDITYCAENTNLRAHAYPKNIKTESGNIVRTEQGTMADTMNKSNSSVHGVQGVLESSQAIVVDDIVDSQDFCVLSNDKSEPGHAAGTRLHPNTEASRDGHISLADNVTEPQILSTTIDEPHTVCMARHTESELNPFIVVQSDERINANVVRETIDVEDSQEIDMPCGVGSTLEPACEIAPDENSISEIGNEVTLMDNVVQVREHGKETNSEQKSLVELCENLESNTVTESNEIKHLDYKYDNNFNLVTEVNPAQLKHEKDACLSCFCCDSKHWFAKSHSVVDRKTTDTYRNNSAKISESESPVQNFNCCRQKSSENEPMSILPNLLVHEFTGRTSTSVHEKTNQASEKKEPTYATSSNSVSKSSRDSLIDFIKQQWRTCQASVTDPATYEQPADLLINSHFSSCDTSHPSSSTLGPGKKKLFFDGDVEDKTQKELQSLHKVESYETMCSDRRENYLKICRTLENYYQSSSHDDSNRSVSTLTRDPQTRQNSSMDPQRKKMSETSGNVFLQVDTAGEMPRRSETRISKNTCTMGTYEKSLQLDYQTVNSFLESTRKFLNADVKQDLSGLNDSGAIDLTGSQMNQFPTSPCAETTNHNVMLNTAEPLSSKLGIPNNEIEWLTNRIKLSQSIVTNKRCEFYSLLTAVDKLLEQYFRSIEELQSRLENCYTRALKYNKSQKSPQKGENKLHNMKNRRQKKEILSDSALNLFQSLNYDCLNSVNTADSTLTRLGNREIVKSLAWNCSVNNKQDSLPDSVASDIDVIDAPHKRQHGDKDTVSGKEPSFDAALNREPYVAVNDEPQQQPEASLESPKEKMPEAPAINDIASPAGKPSTSKKGSGKTSQRQTPQFTPARMQGYQSKQAGVDSATLPRLSSRLFITPGYPETPQGSSDSPSPRYRKHTPGSDRASIDYLTRDVGTITRENQLTDAYRKVYSAVYDTDVNRKPTFSPIRRMRTTEKQESYNLTTTEQEYVRQPLKPYRYASPEYVDSQWTPTPYSKPELPSNGKSVISTEPSKKYYFASTESRDYSNGGMMSRDPPEKRDYGGQTTFSPTFNPQSRVRIPDYCLNQPRGFSRQTDGPTTPPRRDVMRSVWEGHDKKTKTQGSDPRELSEARAWFRDLCQRFNTSFRINGSVGQRPRRTHEENVCGGNLRFDARISVTPKVGDPVNDCQISRHNTMGVRDYRSSPFKEDKNKFRSLEVDNRLLDPSKNYTDIALLETSPILDSNVRRRPQGISDYMYSRTEAPADNKYAPVSDADPENTDLVRQNDRPPKTKIGTQFELNDPIERHLEKERQIPARIDVGSIKECTSVCIQTCACISKPNGTCLCGHISLNETIRPNKTNGPLALNPVRNTEQNLNFKSVCIQCGDEDGRIDKKAFQKDNSIVKEMRSRQCSPIHFKCRNKKCQIGRSVQCKKECTGTGPSFSNDLPCKTVSTHCHLYDRKTEPYVVTARTKCVQTCSFLETKNKPPSRQENIICCKCKQTLDGVLIRHLETTDLPLQLATDSYERNDKECQCNTLQECLTSVLDAAGGNESVHPSAKYQTTQSFVQNCTCKDGQENNALANIISEDVSDEEWEYGKENESITRYQPSQAERALHHTVDSGNACALSHELTEQIAGIIRNSRLLQQQAVLLRNKCKCLEGQGWTSINQNRHHAVSACRSLKCSNMLSCHSLNKNPDRFMDKNNNANTELKRKQEKGSQYSIQLDCLAWSMSSQLTSYKSDQLCRHAGSDFRRFIRKYLANREQLQLGEYFLCKQENKDYNWNVKSPEQLA